MNETSIEVMKMGFFFFLFSTLFFLENFTFCVEIHHGNMLLSVKFIMGKILICFTCLCAQHFDVLDSYH